MVKSLIRSVKLSDPLASSVCANHSVSPPGGCNPTPYASVWFKHSISSVVSMVFIAGAMEVIM